MPVNRMRDRCKQSRAHSRQRGVLALVLALVLVVGVVGVVGRAADFSRVVDGLRDATWGWLALCVLGEIAAYAGYIVAYRDGARVDGGPELSYRLAAAVVAFGFGAFVVGAAAGGLAVSYWALHRAGASRRDAVQRVLALNTLQWLVLGAGAAIAGAFALAGFADVPIGMSLAWLLVVPACVAAAAALTAPRLVDRLTAQPIRPASREGVRGFAKWVGFVAREALADALGGVVYVRRLVTAPARYPGANLGYVIYWGGDILCLYGGLRAFGVHIGLFALVLAYATGYVATSLPLPAGGTGGIEAAMTFALSAVGVPLAPALLAVLAYRLFNFWFPIVPALLLVPALRRLGDRLDATARSPRVREATNPA